MFLSVTAHLQPIHELFCLFSSSGCWTVGDCPGSIFGAQIQKARPVIHKLHCQPHIFKTADYETFCQILPVALESKKDNGWWFCFLKNNPKFKLFWVPSGSPTVQILMFRIQHIHRFSLIQLVLVCVHSPVGAVNEASSPPTPDQQSEGSWRVWTRSKPLAWSVFCHESSSVLNRSKALGHTWRLSDRYCCPSHLWFQTAGVQLWSEQTSCEESLLDSLIQTRSSSAGLRNFSFRRPLLNPGD